MSWMRNSKRKMCVLTLVLLAVSIRISYQVIVICTNMNYDPIDGIGIFGTNSSHALKRSKMKQVHSWGKQFKPLPSFCHCSSYCNLQTFMVVIFI